MENKTIETSTGKKVVLKQLLSGRDVEYIEQPMLDIRIGINEKGKIGGEMRAGDAKSESLHRGIEKVVVSVDGKTDGVLDLVLDLLAKDYKLVLQEVDKIISGENFE